MTTRPSRAKSLPLLAALLLALLALAAPAGAATRPWIGVRGNQLVNGKGVPVRLLGVNRSGSEYECLYGSRVFDGPTDLESIQRFVNWGANAVRLPLNETCWLGINGISAEVGGAAYRAAIKGYVKRLERKGLYVILDLQWSAPGTQRAESLVPLPDAEHGPAFWTSVAREFKGNRGVLFDLFNEPRPGVSWECWRSGCEVHDEVVGSYRAAGMQQLVNAVRGTGAKQPIMLPGTEFAHNLGGWLSHLPTDPAHALVASTHTYDFLPCYGHCRQVLVTISRHHPVVTDELGETDCGISYITPYMKWADRHKIGYLGWAWTAGSGWGCEEGPSLIRNYRGLPTEYGLGFREHLRKVSKRERERVRKAEAQAGRRSAAA
ncbi:MAG: cellulase family glycosylhydrolase [Actinobacteria bacterium]|nr:cellulase family glycosylhydrolase [Actinomycetota bacterium]